MPVVGTFDAILLDAMCDRRKTVHYTENSYIVQEMDPIDVLLFIKRGRLISMSTYDGSGIFFNRIHHKAGDFCGKELLPWGLESQSSSFQPISTRIVMTLTEVEAYVLTAHDL